MFDLKKISFIVIVPALLIALLVIYFIGKNSGKAKALGEDAEILNNDIKPNQLSYPVSAYKNMADTLYIAMVDPGTDYDTVKSVFAIINTQSDLFQLVKSFGTRSSYTILWLVTPFTGNLIEWLTDELDAEEKQEIISMLESKNIILSI